MKKLIVLVALLVGLAFVGTACADSASDAVGVLLTVDPSFTFSIGEDTVDMGKVAEGNSGGGSVTMYCGTNHNLPWTIQVKSSTVTSGANAIPLSNFKFNTYTIPGEAAGACVGTPTALTLTDQLAYTADATEYSDTDVRVHMAFALAVPHGTTSGTYAATVTATMTE